MTTPYAPSTAGFHLGGEPPADAYQLALVAAGANIDWSAVFGGPVRLGGSEWSNAEQTAKLFDAGGDWLLVIPMSALPGPFQPTADGLRGPLGADRLTLAAWLLLASVCRGGLPDVYLVPDLAIRVSITPDPGPARRPRKFWRWPRAYRFVAGFFEPTGTWSGGNAAFERAASPASERQEASTWLDTLHLPCAACSLGAPDGGTDARLVTWDQIAATAYRLACLAYRLRDAAWLRGESAALPVSDLAAVTPADERAEAGAAVATARAGLPAWMGDASIAGCSPEQIDAMRDWHPAL